MRTALGWAFAVLMMLGGAGFLALTVAAAVQAVRGRRAKPQGSIGPTPMSDEEYARILALYDDEGGDDA